MRRFCTLLLIGLISFSLLGCGIGDIIDRIPGFGGGEGEVADGIHHDLTIEYDNHVYKVYESTLDHDEATNRFEDLLESRGYVISEDDAAEAFFVEEGDVSHGGQTFEDDDHFKYVLVTGSDGDISIFTLLAEKSTVDDYDKNDSNGNGQNGNGLTMPDEDVDGEDSTLIERYPTSIRTDYVHVVEDGDEKVSNTYLVDAEIEDVYTFFFDMVDSEGFEITENIYSPSENAMHIQGYYDEGHVQTHGFHIVAQSKEHLIEITIYTTQYGD